LRPGELPPAIAERRLVLLFYGCADYLAGGIDRDLP
jgi:hypothetical protein